MDNTPKTIEDAASRLEMLGQFGYIVANVEDNDSNEVCTTLFGQNEDEPSPLASMFKLYVLAAVVDAIEQEGIPYSLSSLIQINEQFFSLHYGIVQGDTPGSQRRTMQELAELMIAISDNTATNILMATVGHRAAEQAMRDYGHHHPQLNIPFLRKRDFFLLKLLGKPTTSATTVHLIKRRR